eukprot:7009866-Lingulodinium_polyedra.AAC.1
MGSWRLPASVVWAAISLLASSLRPIWVQVPPTAVPSPAPVTVAVPVQSCACSCECPEPTP